MINDYDSQLATLANNIRIIANMEDPIGRVLKRTEVTKSLS